MKAGADALLVGGWCGAGRGERYQFIDLDAMAVRSLFVDNRPQQQAVLSFVEKHLPVEELPYGFNEAAALLPYFLHPHSFLQDADGRIFVFFKQAPYFRILETDGSSRCVSPGEGRLISSTAFFFEGGRKICLTAASFKDRLQKYRGRVPDFGFEILSYDIAAGAFTRLGSVPRGVIDTLHDVKRCGAGWAAVDMNLSASMSADGLRRLRSLGTLENGFLKEYTRCPFPPSRLFLIDPQRGVKLSLEPSTPCPAHIEPDLVDDSVFYLTCHNISKALSSVVVHGPGAIEKYRYRRGRLERLGRCSGEKFYRVTSTAIFRHQGRSLMAVTIYPNRLGLIDPGAMKLIREITLFEHEPCRAPFVCPKGGRAPLFLAVCEKRQRVYLCSDRMVYTVRLEDAALEGEKVFCEDQAFSATAHAAIIRGGPRPGIVAPLSSTRA